MSLSQEIEQQKIRKVLTSVIGIAGVGLLLAFGLSVLLSRNTIRGIQDIVSVIAAAAEGDLRRTAMAPTGDEIERLASRLNQMITQLRSISGQVQGAASTVNVTADAILQQMDALIGRMEQQSAAVDNTTTSVGKVQEFVSTVAQNTEELFSASDRVLAAIQQTRSSIEEVTSSIGMLTNDLVRISSSVEQVNHSVKHVSEGTEALLSIAQHTESEAHQIDRSFHEILSNASQSQQLAGETMNAVTRGQASVDASIQGMDELKTVVANTAQIIQEVNSWSEQVSSILGIVDEIAEQTSLLALNASIISAQAGAHGRGFAVVADEIKNLATRTKASTKEISTLIHELQGKTEEGVQQTFVGIRKAERGMERANAVREDLTTILDSATRSSNRAGDTLRVIQQTVDSSQSIQISMKNVTEMVANIRKVIQQEEHDIQEVVLAVENISGMSEEVRRASMEQKKAAVQITESMGSVSAQFNEVAEQTNALKQHTQQIAAAIQSIEESTEDTLYNATHIAGETVKNLLHESDVLQKIVNVFKVK